MKTEVIVIPTFNRFPLLCACVKRIRQITNNPIAIFPDRGSSKDLDYAWFTALENVRVMYVPKHDYYGNSYNALEALRWAYNDGWDIVHYIEDDVLVHPDYFKWHRQCQEDDGDMFASMGWVFNREGPLIETNYYQPWYYAIGTCFPRNSLRILMPHCSPLYYQDMPGYIAKEFADSKLNTPYGIEHFEQDGLIQRVIDRERRQTVSPGLAKCTHLGAFGYNRGWDYETELFDGCTTIEAKIARIEELMQNEHWRVDLFGRDIVEREVHHEIPKQAFNYRIKLRGGWETEFVSEHLLHRLPSKINSVPIPRDAELVLLS